MHINIYKHCLWFLNDAGLGCRFVWCGGFDSSMWTRPHLAFEFQDVYGSHFEDVSPNVAHVACILRHAISDACISIGICHRPPPHPHPPHMVIAGIHMYKWQSHCDMYSITTPYKLQYMYMLWLLTIDDRFQNQRWNCFRTHWVIRCRGGGHKKRESYKHMK